MEVLIDDATLARVAGRVGVEALAAMRLKGFRAEIAVYRVDEGGAVESAS